MVRAPVGKEKSVREESILPNKFSLESLFTTAVAAGYMAHYVI